MAAVPLTPPEFHRNFDMEYAPRPNLKVSAPMWIQIGKNTHLGYLEMDEQTGSPRLIKHVMGDGMCNHVRWQGTSTWEWVREEYITGPVVPNSEKRILRGAASRRSPKVASEAEEQRIREETRAAAEAASSKRASARDVIPPPCPTVTLEDGKDAVMERIPDNVRSLFGKQGFSRWANKASKAGGAYGHVLVYSPFQVKNAKLRSSWDSSFVKMQREGTPLKLIVWWYGTEEFDILDQTKFVPFEKARSEVSRAIQEAKLRQSQGQQLRCDEKRLLCGQKAQEADLFQFGNPNEKFLLQIYDAPSDPLENPRKPKIVGRAKTTPSSKKRKKSTDFSSNKKKPLQGVALITRKLRKAEVSSRFLENFLMAEENCPGNNAYYKRMSDLILALQKASTGGSSFIEVTLKAFQEQRLGKIGVATTLYQPSSYVPPEIDIEAATSTGSAYTARAENSNYEDDPVESASSEEPQSATGTAVSVASSDQQNRAWPVKDQEKRLAPIGPLCLHALQSDESVPDLGETSSPPHFQQIPKNNRTQRFKHLRLNLSDSEDGGWTLRSPQNSGVEPEWKDA